MLPQITDWLQKNRKRLKSSTFELSEFRFKKCVKIEQFYDRKLGKIKKSRNKGIEAKETALFDF